MSTSPGGSVHAPTRGHDDVIIRGPLSASASLPSSHARCTTRGRRSLRHAVEIRNKHTHTRDFDRHREDGKQSLERPRCSGQPQGRQNAVADDRGDQCTRRRRAEAKESAQLSTKLLSEGGGNAAAVDVHPARHSQENREPEGVAIDRDDDFAESPHLAGRALHHRVPCETGFHGDEHGGDEVRIAEIRDGALLGLQSAALWICGDGFPEVIFDLSAYASRKRWVEIELPRQPFYVLRDHAGFLWGRLPLNRPPMASENCSQTARRSTSARWPRRVIA